MSVTQKVLDTLVAPTYTCVVSSHSHSHSPRQYLDETVETKRATDSCSTLPQRQSTGSSSVFGHFRHLRRRASGRPSPTSWPKCMVLQNRSQGKKRSPGTDRRAIMDKDDPDGKSFF